MAIPPDHPHRQRLAQLEREATTAVSNALDALRRDIFRGVNRTNIMDVFARLRSAEINEALRQRLYRALLPSVEAGADIGREMVEAQVLGVKATILDPGFDWTLVNEAAREWLRRHTFALVAGEWSVTESTARRLRAAIDDFMASPDVTMNQLIEMVDNMFDVGRGEMIAITEVTKAFAHGNMAAWRGSGVVQSKRWNTARDELVCPICGPLNGVVVEIDGTFRGIYDGPPAHPRCRCWVTPVVDVPGVT